MNYYKISVDVYHADIWYFDDIIGIEPNYNLTYPDDYIGIPNGKLITHVRHGSAETDFTDAGYAFVPCVSERAKNLLLTLPHIEDQLDFLHLEICNYSPQQSVYAMVIKLIKYCVDESNSEWRSITIDERKSAQSQGILLKYGPFYKLAIDFNRTDNCDIFRLGGNQTYAIVSQRFKDLWQGAGLTGMSFSMGLNNLNL